MALKRKNLNMSEELAQWYEVEAEKIGVSHSNLMVMALSWYKDYQASLKVMGQLQTYMSIESVKEMVDVETSKK